MKIVSKILKWIIYIVLGLTVLVNAIILVTGRFYLYKTIPNTIFKGRLSPSLDEYGIFANRKVNIGTPRPWAQAKDFNKKSIAQNYLDEMKRYQTVVFLIVKNDSLRYEQYWDGYSDTSHTNSFSMGKSITSILCGIAIQEGKIKSVDEHVSDFIPQFKQGMDSLLTIKDLLTMSSGMNWVENYISPFAYPAEAYYGSDLMKVTLGYKVTSTPGKEFIYQSGNSTLLGYIITQATGKTLSDYASEKLWKPLGAEQPAYWSIDHEGGMEKAYCCFNSNARDFARIGQLYLDSGKRKIKPITYYIEGRLRTTEIQSGTPFKITVDSINPDFYENNIRFMILDENHYRITYLKEGKTFSQEGTFGNNFVTKDMKLNIRINPEIDEPDFAQIEQINYEFVVHNTSNIVPTDYVIASTTPKLVPYYGYNWWIVSCEGHIIPYCRGILGQYIFVIPDLNMVVVRLGKKRGPVETQTIDGKEYNVPTDAIPYLKAAIEIYGK